MKYKLVLVLLPLAALLMFSCGGLSSACQKAKDCCEGAKTALGTTGDKVEVECEGSTVSVTCSGIGTGGDLGEFACNLVNSTLGPALKKCAKEVTACN